MTELCSIDGCDRRHHARGLCFAHYYRLRRHGDPLGGGIPRDAGLSFVETASAHSGTRCLLWPYGLSASGYPRVYYCGQSTRATRVICERIHGPQPTPAHEVAHSCGNRVCLNPRHLRWATRKENMADTLLHGTRNRGERNGSSKLTRVNVKAIRSQPSRTIRDLANQYGVCPMTISNIRLRKVWKWLED